MAKRTTISSTVSFSSGVSSILGESHVKSMCNFSSSAFLNGEVEPRTIFMCLYQDNQEVTICGKGDECILYKIAAFCIDLPCSRLRAWSRSY